MLKTHIVALLLVLFLPISALAQQADQPTSFEDETYPRVSVVETDGSSFGFLFAGILLGSLATGSITYAFYRHRAILHEEEEQLALANIGETVLNVASHEGVINPQATSMTASKKRPKSIKNHDNKFM